MTLKDVVKKLSGFYSWLNHALDGCTTYRVERDGCMREVVCAYCSKSVQRYTAHDVMEFEEKCSTYAICKICGDKRNLYVNSFPSNHKYGIGGICEKCGEEKHFYSPSDPAPTESVLYSGDGLPFSDSAPTESTPSSSDDPPPHSCSGGQICDICGRQLDGLMNAM